MMICLALPANQKNPSKAFARPYGSWPSDITIASNSFYSHFDALQFRYEQRMSHGLHLQISYTYSKDLATDTSSTTGPNGGIGLVGDQNNPLRRYGPDNFNRPHRFVAS